jgi:hypothetical protein
MKSLAVICLPLLKFASFSDDFIVDSYANDLGSVYDDGGDEDISMVIYDLIDQMKDSKDNSPFASNVNMTTAG